MNQRLRDALTRKIAAHNRVVRIGTIWSGLLVIIMWLVIGFLAHWLILFFASIVHGVDAEAPKHFLPWFLAFCAAWMAAAWWHRMRTTEEERNFGSAVPDILLAPPRATLAVIANFNARVSLKPDDLDQATHFLDRLGRAGKLPVETLETELPDEAARERILGALQTLDLVNVRKSRGDEYLYPLNPQGLVKFLD